MNENCTECKEPERLYKVLADWRMSDVIQKLSDHIREGWEPLGKIESKRGSYSDGGFSEWHEVHIWKRSA